MLPNTRTRTNNNREQEMQVCEKLSAGELAKWFSLILFLRITRLTGCTCFQQQKILDAFFCVCVVATLTFNPVLVLIGASNYFTNYPSELTKYV